MKNTSFTPSTATMPRQISKKFRSYIIARLAETCGLLTNGDAIKSATGYSQQIDPLRII